MQEVMLEAVAADYFWAAIGWIVVFGIVAVTVTSCLGLGLWHETYLEKLRREK